MMMITFYLMLIFAGKLLSSNVLDLYDCMGRRVNVSIEAAWPKTIMMYASALQYYH